MSSANASTPASLPETMSRDEMLKYYSSYANVCAHEALRYQKRIRTLEAALTRLYGANLVAPYGGSDLPDAMKAAREALGIEERV